MCLTHHYNHTAIGCVSLHYLFPHSVSIDSSKACQGDAEYHTDINFFVLLYFYHPRVYNV